MVKKTPAYKNRLRALELERSGGTTNKKKNNKQMDKYGYCLFFNELIFSNCFLLPNDYMISLHFLEWLLSSNQAELCLCGRKKEEELSKELELEIKGAEKPSLWKLVGVRFLLLPYTIGKVRFGKFCKFLNRIVIRSNCCDLFFGTFFCFLFPSPP